MDAYDAIIIGAGPAGMMAAIKAAERGRRVLLLEKMPSAGNKLLISGKGHCNLTNAGSVDKFLEKFSSSGVFLRNAFARFFNDDLCSFFQEAGCKLKTERGGRVFPESDKSADILDVLLKKLKKNKVKMICNEEVVDVKKGDSALFSYDKKTQENRALSPFFIRTKSGNIYLAQNVAVCTGGFSYPSTGSTGFGFELARKFNHDVRAPRPGLVPVITVSLAPNRLSGLALENVKCSVVTGGKIQESRFGDMLFTHFGLSGPIILDLSAGIYDLIDSGKPLADKCNNKRLGANFEKQNLKVFISINLKPALDTKKLDARLKREFSAQPNKALKNIFTGLLPNKLVPEFLAYCGLDQSKKANQATGQERKKMIAGLFDFRFEIIRTKPIKDAIITRGGVSTNQIHPKTMQSRITSGLYFAGEALDVDAKTGGYNMQAAFSTGYVCGENL